MILLKEIYDELSKLSLDISSFKKNNYIHVYLYGATDLDTEFINLFNAHNINLLIVDDKDWATLDSPLVFINCCEAELDSIYDNLYFTRNSLKLRTIPMAFFSNQFFCMQKNEKFSYNEILNCLKTDYGYPPTAFIMNNAQFEDNCNLHNYLDLLHDNIELFNIISFINQCKDECFNVIEQLKQYKLNNNSIELILTKNFIVKSISRKLEYLDKILQKCTLIESEYYKEAEKIQNENQKTALKLLKYSDDEIDNNPFTNHQKLNYGDLFLDIKDFNNLTQQSSNQELAKKSVEIEKSFDHKSELAILGTFSSGKTTFINTLLSSEHKLKTSASHNSAVILNIDYADSLDTECYKICYKKEIEDFQLVHHLDINSSRIEDVSLIGVSKNDVISILENINSNNIIDYSVNVSYLNRTKSSYKNNVALKILKQLESKLKIEPDCHFRHSDLMTNNQNIVLKELKDAIHISFNGQLTKQDETICLTNEGWKTFCEDDTNIFLESPSCYLYAESVDLYVHSSFLENCTITDTPGFGSVTENHDFISNRFLQSFKGTLIVMLKLDMKATSEILYRLINQIYEIYHNNKKNLDSIYFLFNVFDKTCGKHSTLLNNCRILKDKIIEQGFNNPKIYVTNMKSYDKKIDNYLTYAEFLNAIETEVQNDGINKRLHAYNETWTNYLTDKITILEEKLEDSDQKEEERKFAHENALLQQKQLKGFKIKPFNTIKNEIDAVFDVIFNFIDYSLTRKKEWYEAGDDFIDLIKSTQLQLRDNNFLYQIYTLSCGYINQVTEFKIESEYNHIDEDDFYHFGFPAESIIRLFERLRDESWGIFWWKTEDKIEELTNRISKEKDKSLQEMKKKYSEMIAQINTFYETANAHVNQSVIETSSDEERLKAIAQYKEELNEINDISMKFKKLNHKILQYLK